MTSRKGAIIAIANQKSQALFDKHKNQHRYLKQLERIRSVCQELLEKRPPVNPTHEQIAEVGGNRVPGFPAKQNISNHYAEMARIWSKAYEDILNMDTPLPKDVEAVQKIDPNNFEPGSRAVIADLKHWVGSLTMKLNGLKQIISEFVPTPAHDLPDSAESAMCLLGEWIRQIESGPFDIDDVGVRVSSRSRLGTVVISTKTFNALRTLAEDFELAVKARRARGDT
jgi:hypothetical protein